MSILTKYQKRLVCELQEIYDILSLDFYGIKAYPKEQRTTRLELMKRAAVRAEVVTTYTLVHEYRQVATPVRTPGATATRIRH